MKSLSLLAGSAVLSGVAGWEFPPIAAVRQHPLGIDDEVDIVSGSQFNGLKTFANLPYVNCFSDQETEAKRYDIAILGAPFDTTTTGRPGARFGPSGVRVGSQRMSPEAGWNVHTGKNTLNSWASIVDCGDAPLTWLDNNVALKQLDKAHKVSICVDKSLSRSSLQWQVISGRTASNITKSKTPRILTLGGDHTTTLSALRSTYLRWGEVSVIHFDSHIGRSRPSPLE